MVKPIFLKKARIQALEASLINPPPPAAPEFPEEDPSVFNLYHPLKGLSHLILLSTRVLLVETDWAQNANSVALFMTSLWID